MKPGRYGLVLGLMATLVRTPVPPGLFLNLREPPAHERLV
jgi:hypothetical protein